MTEVYQSICAEFEKEEQNLDKISEMSKELDQKYNFYSFGTEAKYYKTVDQEKVNENFKRISKGMQRTDLVIRQTEPVSVPLRIHSF